MDLDDYADNVQSDIADIAAYAAQHADEDLKGMVDKLSEDWESLDSFLDFAVVGWLDDEPVN